MNYMDVAASSPTKQEEEEYKRRLRRDYDGGRGEERKNNVKIYK